MSTEAAQSHTKAETSPTLPEHDLKEPSVDSTVSPSSSTQTAASDKPIEAAPEDKKTPVEKTRTSQHAALNDVEDKLQSVDLGSSAIAPAKSASDVAATPQGLHESDSEATAVSAGATSPTLDALLSPKEPEHFPFPMSAGVRESIAETDITDTDDEGRFSTVPLSARQSFDAVDISDEKDGEEDGEAVDIVVDGVGPSTGVEGEELDQMATAEGNDLIRIVHTSRVHKKTASTSTIVSGHNVPFIVARLEGEGDTRRKSADGEERIKEEFGKKHSSRSSLEAEMVDWSFWGEVVSDYQKYASTHPEQLAKAIEKGIPRTLRGMIWQLMSASKNPELEQTYLKLLKESSPHEKAITRDLGRTFPHHAFFNNGQGIGQENLFNVLKAYSLYDTAVGYCQGLPFVVAILLLNMPDEEAFCLLVRLMHSYDMRGHFLPEMPKLQLRMFQFDRLVEDILPVLHVHFLRQGVKSSMYCSQWFLTMFSYRFPLDIVFRIYDNVLASGIEALFSFSLVLLHKNEESLLNLKFDQLLVFLNTKMLDIYQIEPPQENDPKTASYDVDLYVQDAVSLHITPFMLDQYANEYEELVRKRDAHAIEMDNLRNSNRTLSTQVHTLEENLAQLNTEHVKILNELVMARLRNEELESELVRYKLLYAEAMHQNEDSLSSHRISRASFNRRTSGGSSIAH